MTIVCSATNASDRIALTFDDGPMTPFTEQILEALAASDAQATFFVRGGALSPTTSEVVRQAHAAGHEIGNHTENHRVLSMEDEATLKAEVSATHDRLTELLEGPPRVIRPPYGRGAHSVDKFASTLGYRATVLWNICPQDWDRPPANRIATRVMAGECPYHDEIAVHCGWAQQSSLHGGIVLLHDGALEQDDSRAETVTAVRDLIPRLQARGLRLVTVSDLLA
jgi:peptidoglycan-N-acetylglucosamine deacetylase